MKMQIFTRSGFIALAISLTFGTLSCKKDETSTVDQMVGTYNVEARVIAGTGTITGTTFEVRKVSDSQVEIVMALDSTDLPVGRTNFTVSGQNLTEIQTVPLVVHHPFFPDSVNHEYKRSSTGKWSSSYLVIDGTFVSDSLKGTSIDMPITYKMIGVRKR